MKCSRCERDLLPHVSDEKDGKVFCPACFDVVLNEEVEPEKEEEKVEEERPWNPDVLEREPDTFLTISIGNASRKFQIGNLLNALDELVGHFKQQRKISKSDITDQEIARALRLYAENQGWSE